MKCPDCGAGDAQMKDADCYECNGSCEGEGGACCESCDGMGCQDGVLECTECGMQNHYEDCEDDDDE